MGNSSQEAALKELKSLREDFAEAVKNTRPRKPLSFIVDGSILHRAFQKRLDSLDVAIEKAFSPVPADRQDAISRIEGFKEEFDSLIQNDPKKANGKWYYYSKKMDNILKML